MRLSQWLGKGLWAVVDQALFASSNFVLSILLARWLIPSEYGAYTVAYTTFWVLSAVHTGLLTEPMMVYGPSRYRGRLPEYLGAVLYGHVGFVVLGSFVFLSAGLGLRISGSTVLPSA